MSAATTAAVPAASRIKKLDQQTVNRIAAGEVIHRPASALKELLENSLDAGATSISVLAKGGGLKLLQIQDNGHGILRDDFVRVCERFATSKLTEYEDLEKIETFGFRGEALASISHVAHVTITSMTSGSPCAYRACYADGHLAPAQTGDADVAPKPCAGTRGTIIVAEDMFYNVPARRNAMKGPGEEYGKLLPIVQAYALDNPGVALSCRKGVDGGAELATQRGMSSKDVVRLVHGSAIAKELVEISGGAADLGLRITGLITNANHASKRLTFLLFINKRLVESQALRKAVEEVYAAYLPKGAHPFIYLSLRLPPAALDVNVHPTKREVHFLDSDKVVESVQSLVREKLVGANAQRTFLAQAVLPGMVAGAKDGTGPSASGGGGASSGGGGRGDQAAAASSSPAPAGGGMAGRSAKPAADPRKQVRTGGTGMAAGELDKYVLRPSAAASAGDGGGGGGGGGNGKRRRDEEEGVASPAAGTASGSSASIAAGSAAAADGADDGDVGSGPADAGASAVLAVPQWIPGGQRSVPRASEGREWTPCMLTSIQNLLRRVTAQLSRGLQALFTQHTYVGSVDRRYILLQHLTKLYVVHIGVASEAFLYQQVLRGWGNHAAIRLATPVPIDELYLLGLGADASASGASDEARAAAADAAALLEDKAEMLVEYLSIEVADGCLCALPQLIEGYVPPLNGLPRFVHQLAEAVDWTTEQPCFEGLARQLARLYRIDRVGADTAEPRDGEAMDAAASEAAGAATADAVQQACSEAWTIQHVMLPAMRRSYEPPNAHASSGAVVQAACTEMLYKTFERC